MSLEALAKVASVAVGVIGLTFGAGTALGRSQVAAVEARVDELREDVREAARAARDAADAARAAAHEARLARTTKGDVP